jgi:dihydroxy-acid dehydratase
MRSKAWFDNPDNPDMTALYLERYLNFGLSREELQSGKPIIGIAQTGSDISPCNRHHLELAKRVRDGIRDAGGIAMEFPVHPIQETGKRPTAGLDRNLAYLSLVEVLYGYPLDGVVLTIGCDKTTPAMLMAPPPSTFRLSRCRSARCSTAGSAASAPARAPSCGRRAR